MKFRLRRPEPIDELAATLAAALIATRGITTTADAAAVYFDMREAIIDSSATPSPEQGPQKLGDKIPGGR